MNDPYATLGLTPTSSEEQIRARDLELVRQHPPDREPERFAAIREAYDRLRDPVARLEAQLFRPDVPETVDAVAADLRRWMRTQRFSPDKLLALGDLP